MVKTNKISVDAKTGETTVKQVDAVTVTPSTEKEHKIDLEEVSKLVTYAKAQGWI